MTTEKYDIIKKELLDLGEEIENAKRPAYVMGNEDCLYNFKSSAQRLGTTPMQSWGNHFIKHTDSILAFVKDENIAQAEPIETRFADALNYLKLGYALYKEKMESQTKNKPSNK